MSELLLAWYRYAAAARGFIGAALHTHRSKTGITQEQQRALLHIQDTKYDLLWLRLQAIPLPRTQHFTTDLARIVAAVGRVADLASLEVFLRIGLEEDQPDVGLRTTRNTDDIAFPLLVWYGIQGVAAKT